MSTSTGFRRLISPILVGRQRELRLLLQAALHPPALVLVEGEAGAGKSRLLLEMQLDPAVKGRQVLLGHCPPLREPFLLGPLVEAVRQARVIPGPHALNPVAGALRPFLPELADRLPPLPHPLFDARAERHRVFRALREVLVSLGPIVCILEDVHWADEGTFEFLQFLLPQPPPQLALVLSHRRGDPRSSASVRKLAGSSMEGARSTISLAPLEQDEVGRLVAAILHVEEVPSALITKLYERTAGIPFAVEEVVSLLQERAAAGPVRDWRAQDVRLLSVPPALRDSILERTGLLGDVVRCLTEASAVIGVPVSEQVLVQVAGLPAPAGRRGISEAILSSLMIEQGEDRFGLRHPLAIQAVYEALPSPERRRLHLRAADALGRGPAPLPLALLAHHYRHAGFPLRAAEFAEAAADAAGSYGDDREAARFLQDTLLTPGISRSATIRMATKLGTAALFADRPKPAADILRRVLEVEDLPTVVAGELRFSLSRLLYHAGDAVGWYELMVQAVEELRSQPALAARAMSNLARPRLMGRGVEENLSWLHQALGTSLGQRDPAVTVAVLAARATVLLSIGDATGWEAVDDIPWQALGVDERLELVRGTRHLAVAATLLGHHRKAEHFLDLGGKILDELEHVRWSRWLQTARVTLDYASGRWSGLERRASRLLDETLEIPVLALDNEIVVGCLLLSRGDQDEAAQRLSHALEAADAARSIPGFVAAAGHLARLCLSRGEAGRACVVTSRAVDAVRLQGTWAWIAPVAAPAVDALLATGRCVDAARLVAEVEGGLQNKDAPAAVSALTFAQAALAEAADQPEVGEKLFAQADRSWAGLPGPYEAAGARARRGQSQLAQGDHSGASSLLDALEDFESLGATGDGECVRRLLRTNGVALPYPWRGGRRSYGSQLSPREAQVAGLVALGRTNREIAEALFLSPRTVEGHVTAARRKLGVPSRKDLAAIVPAAMAKNA